MTFVTDAPKPDISRQINSQLWYEVETYYQHKIGLIHIPEDPKPFDITRINSNLEALYHEARLDFYYTSKSFERISDAYKKLKRSLWPIVKGGKNEAERDHLMQEYLLQTTLDKLSPAVIQSLGLPAAPVNVYVMYDTYKERMDYMKAVMDIISDKTSRLITDSGAMKIESMLGS